MRKPAPRPWDCLDRPYNRSGRVERVIVDAAGRPIAKVYTEFASAEEAEATRRLIINAVNKITHD